MTVDILFSAKPSSSNFICAIIFLLETDITPAALFSYPRLITCFPGWLQAVISEPPLGGVLGNALPLCTKSSFLNTIVCSHSLPHFRALHCRRENLSLQAPMVDIWLYGIN